MAKTILLLCSEYAQYLVTSNAGRVHVSGKAGVLGTYSVASSGATLGWLVPSAWTEGGPFTAAAEGALAFAIGTLTEAFAPLPVLGTVSGSALISKTGATNCG